MNGVQRVLFVLLCGLQIVQVGAVATDRATPLTAVWLMFNTVAIAHSAWLIGCHGWK